MGNISRETVNKVEWFVAVISDFASRFGIKMQMAYSYLKSYGGLDFLERHYEIIHTFSIDQAVEDTIAVCNRKGGGLI